MMKFALSAPLESPFENLARTIEEVASPCDADGSYPQAAMDVLVRRGLTAPSALLPSAGCESMRRLLRLLAEVGRGDASVGRLFEGHANALELIDRLAPSAMRVKMFAAVRKGAVLGVWGADPQHDRLRVKIAGDTLHLQGGKIFCSGADGLDFALVLADVAAAPERRRVLVLVPVDERLTIDRTAWRPLGMRASGSHSVAFDRVTLNAAETVVCDGAAYLEDPWFTSGAMRFAAVQAGVARGLAEVAAAHLVGQGRAGAPHQAARLGSAAVAVVELESVLASAGAAWDEGCAVRASEAASARAAVYGSVARVAAESALLEIADTVQRAVGLGGLIAPHPLEHRLRDALTYVRQPNPDGAREAVGKAFASGLLAASRP